MSDPMKGGRTGHNDGISAKPGNFGTHFGQHGSKINDVGFASGVLDSGSERLEGRKHEGIFSGGDGGFIEKDSDILFSRREEVG